MTVLARPAAKKGAKCVLVLRQKAVEELGDMFGQPPCGPAAIAAARACQVKRHKLRAAELARDPLYGVEVSRALGMNLDQVGEVLLVLHVAPYWRAFRAMASRTRRTMLRRRSAAKKLQSGTPL